MLLEDYTFSIGSEKIKIQEVNGVFKAKNIRYAKSERYQLPIPVSITETLADIPVLTPVCPQHQSAMLERLIEPTHVEDFLVEESPQYLSITFPKDILPDEKLSVIVWIHGGSYEIGCGSLPTSDPSVWVKEQRIIVVSVSYRLGLFGFLGGYDERPANLGLFDIIEALKWIRTNISAFGGNPENITLLGQSSGGDAVTHLMIAEGAEGLFKRAIIQSAPLGLREKRQKMSEEFSLKTSLIKDDSDFMKMVDEYSKFRPSLLKYGLKAAMPFGLQYGFPPMAPENKIRKLWKDHAAKYDVLIGLNDEETAFYLRTSGALQKYTEKGFGKKILDKTIRLTTEKIYGKPAAEFASSFAKAGGNVYLFRIFSKLESNKIGAAHCLDLPLLFGNEETWKHAELLKGIPWAEIDKVGKKIRAIWAEFAKNGSVSENSDKPEVLKISQIRDK
ncbi:para-nitrobenzyl esterase [Elizabethkingia miricola]|uniref:Carboxylic ester hydrolase n=1 Tax=Elizabethkingia miricola TaxID=172045 RepID=A0ABD4DN39_ELIMR|nr:MULTISPECIES: carboxylesterase family protein [Elizabethkingia]KUY20142.1 para-nitrobenzyl esterase [Elizabethkingia miricola]MCL1653698.1 carboxylesterase family protein [Elizabethkingia miricola]OPC69970.1 para-nitrobenzyl esterase [Elizabethkingia miricola]OPC73901.1 para-nitrobenzyl esterase [Elizabethkingia miricola]QCO45689.1 carboxylesterase family protein [Elizabethkingia sp. 2-6]